MAGCCGATRCLWARLGGVRSTPAECHAGSHELAACGVGHPAVQEKQTVRLRTVVPSLPFLSGLGGLPVPWVPSYLDRSLDCCCPSASLPGSAAANAAPPPPPPTHMCEQTRTRRVRPCPSTQRAPPRSSRHTSRCSTSRNIPGPTP
eukprot:352687-Chlamydomonas_euryale.AAC.1